MINEEGVQAMRCRPAPCVFEKTQFYRLLEEVEYVKEVIGDTIVLYVRDREYLIKASKLIPSYDAYRLIKLLFAYNIHIDGGQDNFTDNCIRAVLATDSKRLIRDVADLMLDRLLHNYEKDRALETINGLREEVERRKVSGHNIERTPTSLTLQITF